MPSPTPNVLPLTFTWLPPAPTSPPQRVPPPNQSCSITLFYCEMFSFICLYWFNIQLPHWRGAGVPLASGTASHTEAVLGEYR